MSCSRPFQLKKDGITYNIPCRWCMSCRIDRRNEWADRLLFECQGKRNTFLTLTYNDRNLPENESLRQQDTRLYIERLRQRLKRGSGGYKPVKDWKFYLVGEYGGKFKRPHYHIILTGIDSYEYGQLLNDTWGMGETLALPASSARITYTLKYIEKEEFGINAEELYDKTGRERPYHTMSKGIGKKWIMEHIDEIQQDGGYYYKGKIRPLCKYYKDIMAASNPTHNIIQDAQQARKLGYESTDDMKRIQGRLKELHLIREMRNTIVPIDIKYLNNYVKPSNMKEWISQIEDLEKWKGDEYNYIYQYDLFGGKYE